jgi:hypothetical protein
MLTWISSYIGSPSNSLGKVFPFADNFTPSIANIASHFFASVYGALEVFLEAIKLNDGLQILPQIMRNHSLLKTKSQHAFD